MTDQFPLRLGFHYHVPAEPDGRSLRMPGYQGRFVDALASRCQEVICLLHTPLPHERAQLDYKLDSTNVRFVDLGPHTSVPRRLLLRSRSIRAASEHAGAMDAILLRAPSPLLPALGDALQTTPTALLVVGDAVASSRDSRQSPLRRVAVKVLWRWNRIQQNRIAERALVFVNSRVLMKEFRPHALQILETRTTTLRAGDFYVREDTCTSSPVHLLYAGRITLSKGLLDILEALRLLVARGLDLHLNLVGWSEQGDNCLEVLRAKTHSWALDDRVHFVGPKSVGPQLFACYRDADVFVTASTSSEGFPRTIWEAMANSLPVVATRIGSIPAFAHEAAELAPPASPASLADAIARVVHDGTRRREMILRGRALAATTTLETSTEFLLSELCRFTQARHAQGS